MSTTLSKLIHFIHDTQLYAAILLGMFIQYMFSATKTMKGVMLIVVVTIFSAWFIVPMFIDIFNIMLTSINVKFQIEQDSRIAIGLYATSSLISVEFIAILMTLLPKAIRKIITERIDMYFRGKDGLNDSK